MRRRRFRKPAISVALFPFLAVLVCTMGALIVLLVLVVQQARVYATGVADSTPAEPEPVTEELVRAQEDFLWRREILETQRVQLREKLADSRLHLGHLEDHIRRLEQRWQQLQASAAQLEQLTDAAGHDQSKTLAERDRIRSMIKEAELELNRVREEVSNRPRSFAIIPYPGPSGTERRPIYIECTAQGIILQPEGVVLRAGDFDGPLGPGNPLDAALRATREHLASLGSPEIGEPYPLLVVRPDGAIAYNVARLAMKAWDDEFGYELVDDQMQLEYPPADPNLKRLLEAAIQDARQRQSALAAAMPSQFRGGLAGGFVPTSYPADMEAVTSTGRAGERSSASNARAGRGTGGSHPGEPSAFPSDRQFPMGAAERSRSLDALTAAEGGNPVGPTSAASGAPGGASMSLARTRGTGWALPNASANTTAITRPIRVICYPHHLMILPNRDDARPPRVIEMPHGPQQVLDQFVAAIQDHIESWGIAVAGGYWKPTLQVLVEPGGEIPFEQLQRLLDDSGIDLQRERL